MTEGMTDVGRIISRINNTPSKERKWKRAALRYVREMPISEKRFPTLSEIASVVGCTREFLRVQMAQDSDFGIALKHRLGDNHGKIVDAAERLLYKKITINEDLGAAQYALDRLDSNYVKKSSIKTDNTNTTINIDISISEQLARAEEYVRNRDYTVIDNV